MFFQELDDRVAKSSPNLTKICRHDHKGLVNTSTEGINELLHGLGEIVEILSKIGVFSRTPKRRYKETRDSGGFCTRLDGLESPQRVTQSPRNDLSSLGIRGMEFWVIVLRLIGKGGPILLVPSGVLNSIQSRMICALFWMNSIFLRRILSTRWRVVFWWSSDSL